jgi:protein-disulfide isomerase
LHPLARQAAEAARCANEQGKYWKAHEFFFDNQPSLQEVIRLSGNDAVTVGVDSTALNTCVKSGKYAEVVQRDLLDGVRLGVKGTPTFFLGFTDPTDPSRVRVVKSLVGGLALREFQAVIEELLGRKSE